MATDGFSSTRVNNFLGAAHTGHVKVIGTSSHLVLGKIPFSGIL
jgi:hypothetical protein